MLDAIPLILCIKFNTNLSAFKNREDALKIQADKEGVLYNFYIHENSYSKKELNLISKTIDTKLISLNIEYEQKRKSMRILQCSVQEVPHNFFMDLRKSYAKGGKHDYQIKVPKLIVLEKDKIIVEKLLKEN